MPNWVNNTLTVEGDYNTVSLFKNRLARSYEAQGNYWNPETKEYETKTYTNDECFSFWNVIQPPQHKLGLYFASANGTEDKTWNWYNWNNRNWGTKWDACHPEIVSEEDSKIVYTFDTAWSAPMPVIAKLTDDFPELEITLRYVEEQGWGGVFVLKNNKVLSHDTWDIPDSHEDSIKYTGECWCEGYDDDDKPFKDCPKS